MNDSTKTLVKLKKASKLVRLAQRKNGPKSYKRGQGALLRVLLDKDGAEQRELTSILGVRRAVLKDTVRKASRNGYVAIENTGKKSYAVYLTDEGRALARKHEKAQDKVADEVLSALTSSERDDLDNICEKLIVSLKEAGIDGKKKGRKVRRKRSRARRK